MSIFKDITKKEYKEHFKVLKKSKSTYFLKECMDIYKKREVEKTVSELPKTSTYINEPTICTKDVTFEELKFPEHFNTKNEIEFNKKMFDVLHRLSKSKKNNVYDNLVTSANNMGHLFNRGHLPNRTITRNHNLDSFNIIHATPSDIINLMTYDIENEFKKTSHNTYSIGTSSEYIKYNMFFTINSIELIQDTRDDSVYFKFNTNYGNVYVVDLKQYPEIYEKYLNSIGESTGNFGEYFKQTPFSIGQQIISNKFILNEATRKIYINEVMNHIEYLTIIRKVQKSNDIIPKLIELKKKHLTPILETNDVVEENPLEEQTTKYQNIIPEKEYNSDDDINEVEDIKYNLMFSVGKSRDNQEMLTIQDGVVQNTSVYLNGLMSIGFLTKDILDKKNEECFENKIVNAIKSTIEYTTNTMIFSIDSKKDVFKVLQNYGINVNFNVKYDINNSDYNEKLSPYKSDSTVEEVNQNGIKFTNLNITLHAKNVYVLDFKKNTEKLSIFISKLTKYSKLQDERIIKELFINIITRVYNGEDVDDILSSYDIRMQPIIKQKRKANEDNMLTNFYDSISKSKEDFDKMLESISEGNVDIDNMSNSYGYFEIYDEDVNEKGEDYIEVRYKTIFEEKENVKKIILK